MHKIGIGCQAYRLIILQLKLRLRTLLNRKRLLQSRSSSASKVSSIYITLDEGFRLFNNDLDKLQQFVEINQTAFSKILKKWDKTSKVGALAIETLRTGTNNF